MSAVTAAGAVLRLAAAPAASMVPDTQKLIDIAGRLGLLLLVAFLAQRGLFLVVGRVERFFARHHGHGFPSEARARTIGAILRNVVTVVIATFTLIYGLEIFGWDVKPLLAGAGIVGVALGFGAQTLVRDVIAGIFILIENQYSVGDVIEVNGQAATVESFTVRSTRLRDFNGYVHFVPNGEMKVVTNRSREWNRLPVDVIVANQGLDRALVVSREVLDRFNADDAWRRRLLDPVEVWGVESATGDAVTLRCVVRALPGKDAAEAARELRRRLLEALTEAGLRPGAVRDPASWHPAATAPPHHPMPPSPADAAPAEAAGTEAGRIGPA